MNRVASLLFLLRGTEDGHDQTQCCAASFRFLAPRIGGPEVWTAGFGSKFADAYRILSCFSK
jgi:hypothetical protein